MAGASCSRPRMVPIVPGSARPTSPSTNRVTSTPSSNRTTSGPMPRRAAISAASCSCSRSIPSRSVSLPPIRRTSASPSTQTLKLWFVIPPPSASTSTCCPGQSRPTACSTRMRDPRLVTALLFDFNGTLSDDEGIQCAIFRELFAEQGRPLSEQEYFDELAGRSDPEIVERWLGRGHPATVAVLERRVQLFRERAGDGSTVPQHVREAVLQASARSRLAVVSGAMRSEIDMVLRAAGLDVFEVIVSAEGVTRGKPDPEGYLLALRRLRLQAADAVAIE